ncbi:diguanylate cyclase [Chitinibacter tainanensis]|uniref:GGDEF domain-containing protein n=1 Tax=Chitinibacter tainanensis TaxID=230667 RepID=UPI002352907B|nr:GGDEF domain-containing protein [Chitinibacter tainanensis]
MAPWPEYKALLQQAIHQPYSLLPELPARRKAASSISERQVLMLLHGIALANTWQYAAAEPLLTRATLYGRRQKQYFALDYGLDALASLYLVQGNVDKAMQTWMACFELGLKTRDRNAIMLAHLGVGKTYFGLHDFHNAKNHHLATVDIVCSLPNHQSSCEAYVCLAVDLIKLCEFAKAAATLEVARQYLPWARHPKRSTCEIELYFGMTLAGSELYPAAQLHFERAIELATEADFSWGLALAELESGKVWHQAGDDDRALTHLARSEALASALQSSLFLRQCHELQYQIHKDRGDYLAALTHMQTYTQLSLQAQRESGKMAPSSRVLKKLRQYEAQLELATSQEENVELTSRLRKHQDLIAQLTQKAETDALTGVFNRRALDQRIVREFELADLQQQDFSLLMIDLDHFKAVNDQFSHQMGDKVLQAAAQLIVRACRQGEFVARYGGEEFCVLLPGAPLAAASNVAERIRLQLAQFAWAQLGDGPARMSCSIGAACRQAGEDSASLLKRADLHLYQAKAAGRDRVFAA